MLVLPVLCSRGKLLLEEKRPCPGTPIWCIGLGMMALCARRRLGRFGARLPL
jgi:hypothetical protein